MEGGLGSCNSQQPLLSCSCPAQALCLGKRGADGTSLVRLIFVAHRQGGHPSLCRAQVPELQILPQGQPPSHELQMDDQTSVARLHGHDSLFLSGCMKKPTWIAKQEGQEGAQGQLGIHDILFQKQQNKQTKLSKE